MTELMTKKRKGYGFKQGKFTPVNKEKYKGSYPIQYRSSWELKFMMYCDRNTKIINWGSESVVLKYKDPSRNNTIHRYFMDFNFTIVKDGKPQTFLVEIKPYSQTRPPKRGRKALKNFLNESMTWVRNKAKWEAAEKFCRSKGWKFLIFTEKELLIS